MWCLRHRGGPGRIGTVLGMMTTAETGVAFLDLVTAHDLDGLCALVTDDWTMHGGPPGLPPGRAGVHELFRHIGPVRQTWTVEDVVAAGDRVVVRGTNACEQESFFGVPGRGIRQTFAAIFIHRVVDGRVAETWRCADDLGRLLQLEARIGAP